MKICNNITCYLKGTLIVAESTLFCTYCGDKLVGAKTKGICGHEVWLNEKFCGICGTCLLDNPQQDEPSDKEKDRIETESHTHV